MIPALENLSLLRVLKQRRSRRFCKGMEIPDGPLRYKSALPPEALTEEQESLMAFAACGVTGSALADLPFGSGSGGNIMAGLAGRTIASGDAIQCVSLIAINDRGAFLYRRPRDFSAESLQDLVRLANSDRFSEAAERMRVRILAGRATPPREPLFNLNVNRWSVGAPGTTYFLPVNELTFMYINGLLEIFNEDTGAFVLDDRAGFRPAGLGRFAKSKGGHLHDNPADGRLGTVSLVERLVTEFVTVEQGMMLQNLALMAEALGLGGFPNFANHDFGWFEALGFRMLKMRSSAYLAMPRLARLILSVLAKDGEVPLAIGLERDGQPLIKTYAPPYFQSMRAAVEAVVREKFGPGKGVFRGGSMSPWKDARTAETVPEISRNAIEATIAYCEYIWNRYGRFPATMPPLRTVLGFQAGNLDPNFYREFYPPEVADHLPGKRSRD